MVKARMPVSFRRKKRRLNHVLKELNDKKRRLSLQKNGDSKGDEELACPSTSSPAVVSLTGRRIVNIRDFISQMKNLGTHGPLGCGITNMDLVREKREGLRSCFIFRCNFCNAEQTVWSEYYEESVMDVNSCAVSGTITTGGGHSQLEEMMATMDIPPLSDKTFRKYETIIVNGMMSTAAAEMKKAAEEEAKHAVEMGDVAPDGTPLLTVVADGSWGKRSYRTNYSSLSGVAAIVGHHTRKVLYMGVKNKYCTPCARAEAKGEEPKAHACYKNWGMNQSSTSMEAAVIADGFSCSEEMFGVRYARLIADGDSSVYKKILEYRPYKTLTVQNIECKNHLLRNFFTKMRQIVGTSNKKKNTVHLRKLIGGTILKFRTGFKKAADYRRSENVPMEEKVKNLRMDILNVPSHVFGEHKACLERGGYFCKTQPLSDPKNLVPALTEAGLYEAVTEVVKALSRHSRSLIIDVTSNSVEHYNSIVAKYIGGKRINFGLRGSYQGRCSAAVIQHNSLNTHYLLHKNMYDTSPGFFTKSTGIKRRRKVVRQRSAKRAKKCLFQNTKPDEHYGPAAQKPDLEDELMAEETQDFFKSLFKTKDERIELERNTVEQRDSGLWLQVRRNLLTASNFGRVCKMKATTGCESLVKQLLYSTFDCEAMAYGRTHEENARQQLEQTLGKTIQPCGLFLHPDKMYLGATPDGLIGTDGLVEIKCPSSARNMTPEDAIKSRKVTFWKYQNETIGQINKSHDYFYQVQGQLNITGREYCIFAVWTPKGLKVERIERDEGFWNDKMVKHLEKFYINCVVPEIVDPRHRRSMPIRNPRYIMDAQEKARTKKLHKGSTTSLGLPLAPSK